MSSAATQLVIGNTVSTTSPGGRDPDPPGQHPASGNGSGHQHQAGRVPGDLGDVQHQRGALPQTWSGVGQHLGGDHGSGAEDRVIGGVQDGHGDTCPSDHRTSDATDPDSEADRGQHEHRGDDDRREGPDGQWDDVGLQTR